MNRNRKNNQRSCHLSHNSLWHYYYRVRLSLAAGNILLHSVTHGRDVAFVRDLSFNGERKLIYSHEPLTVKKKYVSIIHLAKKFLLFLTQISFSSHLRSKWIRRTRLKRSAVQQQKRLEKDINLHKSKIIKERKAKKKSRQWFPFPPREC